MILYNYGVELDGAWMGSNGFDSLGMRYNSIAEMEDGLESKGANVGMWDRTVAYKMKRCSQVEVFDCLVSWQIGCWILILGLLHLLVTASKPTIGTAQIALEKRHISTANATRFQGFGTNAPFCKRARRTGFLR